MFGRVYFIWDLWIFANLVLTECDFQLQILFWEKKKYKFLILPMISRQILKGFFKPLILTMKPRGFSLTQIPRAIPFSRWPTRNGSGLLWSGLKDFQTIPILNSGIVSTLLLLPRIFPAWGPSCWEMRLGQHYFHRAPSLKTWISPWRYGQLQGPLSS